MTEIKRIESGQRMSQAVVANGMVWLAGQVGAPGKPAADQTRAILAQIDTLLKKAGTDKTRIVSAQIWVADMAADFAAMNSVWDTWVPQGSAPARATGEARLATPDYKVEIIVTAVL
ncbi:RidA family protein [Paracoccus salsus]|uniref:RidA family protein n=1 Tax=Paracoccus salsus TaxID=2911061 RepID=UPI001F43ADA7|nr:RidA family protein [Paracoccus salsus]MCF3974893.1 RidA family protein [Paracoccus salsus]